MEKRLFDELVTSLKEIAAIERGEILPSRVTIIEKGNIKVKTLNISAFKTEREEAEFWEKHSLDEFDEDLEVVNDVTFSRQPKQTS